ncbi:Uncharacterised protein [Chlamydia trachomatis]|nr:Uncharacterised protein [Chlamydia trachomatis]
MEPRLVFLKDLDIVIDKAQGTHRKCREDHQLYIDIVEASEEKRRDDDRYNDDDTTHCWGALLHRLTLQS